MTTKMLACRFLTVISSAACSNGPLALKRSDVFVHKTDWVEELLNTIYEGADGKVRCRINEVLDKHQEMSQICDRLLEETKASHDDPLMTRVLLQEISQVCRNGSDLRQLHQQGLFSSLEQRLKSEEETVKASVLNCLAALCQIKDPLLDQIIDIFKYDQTVKKTIVDGEIGHPEIKVH